MILARPSTLAGVKPAGRNCSCQKAKFADPSSVTSFTGEICAAHWSSIPRVAFV
jgi:hypothetical protein